MRRLIIFRHAKAVPHDAAPDFERALASRGKEAAAEMGRLMADEQLLPDLVLVSPSKRTMQTWERAAPALGETPMRVENGIYEAPADRLLSLVRGVEDSVRTLVLVGHNPGVADLARALIGHGDRYAFARLRSRFVTAGVAVIDFAVDHWKDVKPGDGRLDRFVTPSSTHD